MSSDTVVAERDLSKLTPAQRENLRHWDYFLYWFDYHERKREAAHADV